MILFVPVIGFFVAYIIGSVIVEVVSMCVEAFLENNKKRNNDIKKNNENSEKKVLTTVFIILLIAFCVVVKSMSQVV